MNTETGLQLVPAGWYQDSPDPTQVRWWDGQEWTDHVQTLPPEVAHAPDVESTLTRRQLREQNGSLFVGEADLNAERDAAEQAQQAQMARVAAERAAAEEGAAQQAAVQQAAAEQAERERVESVRIAAARFAEEQAAAEAAAAAAANAPYSPPSFTAMAEKESYVGYRDVQTMQHPKETPATARSRVWNSEVDAAPITVKQVGVQTFAVWLLALLPIWATAAAWQLPLLELTEDKRLPYLVVGLFTLLFSIGLAQSDRRQLRDRGFEKAAGAGWAVFPLLYLVIRAFKMGVGGIAPLITYIALQAAVVLLAFNAAVPIVLAALENAPDAPAAVVEPIAMPLTAEQRELLLTPEGAAEQVTADLAESGFIASSVECLPFPSTEAGAATTCAVTVDGVETELRLLVTPDDAYRAFMIEDPAASSTVG